MERGPADQNATVSRESAINSGREHPSTAGPPARDGFGGEPADDVDPDNLIRRFFLVYCPPPPATHHQQLQRGPRKLFRLVPLNQCLRALLADGDVQAVLPGGELRMFNLRYS